MQSDLALQPAHARPFQIDTRRYAKCIENSRRVRWEIDRDVIRGRSFDFSMKFLPDGLSKVARFGEILRALTTAAQGAAIAAALAPLAADA